MGTAKVMLKQDAAGTSLDRAATKAFEAQRDDAIAQVRQSVQTLLVLVTEKFLNEEYKKQTVALDAEDSGLQAEWEVLSGSRSRLEEIASAKSRVLERKADEAIAAGDMEGSESRKREAREVQQNLVGITEHIQQIESRRAAIVKEKRRLARQIFQEGYPSLPLASFAVIESAVDLLDGFKAGMFSYQTLTGLDPTSLGDSPLVHNFHIEKLTPNGAVGRQLAYKMAEWFHR